VEVKGEEEKGIKNFLSLGREMNIHSHKAQRILNRLNQKSFAPKHTIINLSKVKEK
jgi:hypothetical protein